MTDYDDSASKLIQLVQQIITPLIGDVVNVVGIQTDGIRALTETVRSIQERITALEQRAGHSDPKGADDD